MGYGQDISDFADWYNETWAYGWSRFEIANTRLSSAEQAWENNNDHNAIGYLIQSVGEFYDCFFNMFGEALSEGSGFDWWYFTKHFTTTTWQNIVSAWVTEDFEGRVMTIAVIDRMRQILWDEPFSIEWAARPEEITGG